MGICATDLTDAAHDIFSKLHFSETEKSNLGCNHVSEGANLLVWSAGAPPPAVMGERHATPEHRCCCDDVTVPCCANVTALTITCPSATSVRGLVGRREAGAELGWGLGELAIWP